jgi:PPM family protein phosphatase
VLRVAEEASRTDTGRQRTANEDAYFARAPLFAVADGMGGAQAGEVASRLAAEAFEPLERRSEPAEAYLRSIAESANKRIHSLAEHDSSRSGMGTTLTAAMVEGDEVSLAHVGDSRAYLFRDGDLKMLTSDHSLVEELRRQGRLTDEQALQHPQRSIITRALGPEREVDVDTMTFSARPDDVVLLCSDGLTTMVSDERIAEMLRTEPDLESTVSRLVREANDAGGRDNITVVAFRLEEGAPVAVEEQPTLIGPAAEEAGLAPVPAAAEAEPARRRAPAPAGAPARAPSAGRARLRTAAKVLVVLLVVGGVAFGAWYGARQVYFLGTDEGGRVALYRGLPYDLPGDIELYSELYSAPVRVDSLPEDRRASVTDHELRSRSDAISLLEDLEGTATVPASTAPDRQQQGQGTGERKQGQGRHPNKQGRGQKRSGNR